MFCAGAGAAALEGSRMTDVLKFPAGSAIGFTTGEYSDYSFHGVLIALKEVDLPTLAKAYAAEKRASGDYNWLDLDAFLPWLIVNGYMMAADVESVHLGSYSKFDDEFGVPENA